MYTDKVQCNVALLHIILSVLYFWFELLEERKRKIWKRNHHS